MILLKKPVVPQNVPLSFRLYFYTIKQKLNIIPHHLNKTRTRARLRLPVLEYMKNKIIMNLTFNNTVTVEV